MITDPKPGTSRRAFVRGSAGLACHCFWTSHGWSQQIAASTPLLDPQSLEAALKAALKAKLVTSDPKLMEFAMATYLTCVAGKIKPPAPPLEYAWIVPGGGYYAQWLWDTMFVVDLLAVLPGQSETIRGVFRNYWDFQKRWNAEKPAAQHGMIANFIAPFDSPEVRDGKLWRTFPAYSQAPLLAWGMERVFRRTGDLQLLREGLAPLESFHEWYWRERDVTGAGLIGVGSYSGDAQHARYETYDREVDLDALKMTPHPGRKPGNENGPWYGDILIPANTAYLLLSELSLSRMATAMGDAAMATRRKARYAAGARAMRSHMWSNKQRCFLAVHRDTLQQVDTPTVGGFMPLMAGVPTAAQARACAKTLQSTDWRTPLPIPTVATSNVNFRSSEFWRGDVWPAPNYQVAKGLWNYGLHDAAARIADATISNALKVGISERYDSLSGEPLGVRGLGMSATVLTMMFDGLSLRHKLSVRQSS